MVFAPSPHWEVPAANWYMQGGIMLAVVFLSMMGAVSAQLMKRADGSVHADTAPEPVSGSPPAPVAIPVAPVADPLTVPSAPPRVTMPAAVPATTTAPARTAQPPKAAPAPPAPTAKRDAPMFNNAAAREALRAVPVATCARPGEPRGTGNIVVRFESNGSASSARVTAPFAGTLEGRCLEQKFAATRVPAFSGTSVGVGYSFRIDR